MAMDAGCINIMHEDWFRFDGELERMKYALDVANSDDLADLLHGGISCHSAAVIQRNCNALLEQHGPHCVGKLYMKELLR